MQKLFDSAQRSEFDLNDPLAVFGASVDFLATKERHTMGQKAGNQIARYARPTVRQRSTSYRPCRR